MRPLEGILVVAIEQAVAAPLCSARLVEAGARVIKIERQEGDFARRYDTAAKGESSYFIWLNQGKESLCLDFKNPDEAQLLWAIIEKADVVIQNLAPGSFAKTGFSTDALHARNPSLIVCNISGYGSESPASEKRAYDLLVQAESGLISVSGAPEHPGRIGVSLCDIGAGLTAYSGVLEALLKRAKTGIGEEISISLFDVAVDWMAVPFIHAEHGAGAPAPAGLRHPSIAPYGAFPCADGKQVLISIQNEREWERLCTDVLRRPEFITNPDYKSNNARVGNRDALESDIASVTSTLSMDAMTERMNMAKIAYGAINSAADLRTHTAYRGMDVRTTNGVEVELPARPIRWSNDHREGTDKTPTIGEHTEKIKAEFQRP